MVCPPLRWCCQRRQWRPTPVLLPGKSHGRRSLVGCSPWGRTELDTTKRLHFHVSLACIGEGNGNPLENPMDRGAWWAAVSGVAQSRTRLKRLSSSSGSRWCCVQGTCAAPCFCAPVFKSISRVFWSLRISCPDCPSCARMQLLSVPYHFLVFCCSQRGVPGCKHRSSAAQGPRAQESHITNQHS